MGIPLAIAWFLRRRPDVPFPRVAWWFVAFIFFCGLTHLTDAVIFWHPVYRFGGALKVATAFVSLGTLAVLIRVTPRALALPGRAAHADELERSNRDLEQFAFAASHDLKEPLRKIAGYLELVERDAADALSESGTRYVEKVRDATDRMSAMIEGLLAFSRAGARHDASRDLDTRALVADLLAEQEEEIRGRGARVDVAALPRVHAPEEPVRRLFANLISNALKYSPSEPHVEIDGRREGKRCRFRVRDHGMGIAPEARERVFQLFQRLHARHEIPGTGIGLAICRRIVEGLGGEIRILDPEGPGTAVEFTLPCEAGA